MRPSARARRPRSPSASALRLPSVHCARPSWISRGATPAETSVTNACVTSWRSVASSSGVSEEPQAADRHADAAVVVVVLAARPRRCAGRVVVAARGEEDRPGPAPPARGRRRPSASRSAARARAGSRGRRPRAPRRRSARGSGRDAAPRTRPRRRARAGAARASPRPPGRTARRGRRPASPSPRACGPAGRARTRATASRRAVAGHEAEQLAGRRLDRGPVAGVGADGEDPAAHVDALGRDGRGALEERRRLRVAPGRPLAHRARAERRLQEPPGLIGVAREEVLGHGDVLRPDRRARIDARGESGGGVAILRDGTGRGHEVLDLGASWWGSARARRPAAARAPSSGAASGRCAPPAGSVRVDGRVLRAPRATCHAPAATASADRSTTGQRRAPARASRRRDGRRIERRCGALSPRTCLGEHHPAAGALGRGDVGEAAAWTVHVSCRGPRPTARV